nr:hypothetical protein [Acidobacteriota bacterium]
VEIQGIASPLLLLRPFRHPGVSAITYTRDGRKLVTTAAQPGVVRLWDAQTGKELAPPIRLEPGITGATFSLDGKRVMTAGTGGSVKVWDAASGQELFALAVNPNGLSRLALSPDGKLLGTASDDGTLEIVTLDIDGLLRLPR